MTRDVEFKDRGGKTYHISKNLELSEYTGFKDRLGKKIYEPKRRVDIERNEIPTLGMRKHKEDVEMKTVYIAHPFNGITGSPGEKAANLEKNEQICRAITADPSYSNTCPISPLCAMSFLRETDMSEDKIMELCRTLIDLCSALWVFGEWQGSKGVMSEIIYALENGKTVTFFDFDGKRVNKTDKIYKTGEFCELLAKKQKKAVDELHILRP